MDNTEKNPNENAPFLFAHRIKYPNENQNFHNGQENFATNVKNKTKHLNKENNRFHNILAVRWSTNTDKLCTCISFGCFHGSILLCKVAG